MAGNDSTAQQRDDNIERFAFTLAQKASPNLVELGGGINSCMYHEPTVAATTGPLGSPQVIVVCPSIASIPTGRQATKILKCGIVGCTSNKLFDRKWELERHMKGHEGRKFPCLMPECPRRGDKAFARADKRNEHMRKVHGI